MDLMYVLLFFVIGFLAGGIVSYLFAVRLSSKVKLQDELTRAKREIVNNRRSFDDFLNNASDLFAQLDRSYMQYAKYMAKSSRKLSTQSSELFETEKQEEISHENKNEESESKFTKKLLESQNIRTPEKQPIKEDISKDIIDDVRIVEAKENTPESTDEKAIKETKVEDKI